MRPEYIDRRYEIGAMARDLGLAISIFRDNSTRTRFSFASAVNALGLGLADLDGVVEELHHDHVLPLRGDLDDVSCAGRTDAGVHAWGQVVSFEAAREPDLVRLQQAVTKKRR